MIYLLAIPLFHAFHLAKCEIVYNYEAHRMEMTLMVFTDDLEKAINQQGTDLLDILGAEADENNIKIIGDYLENEIYLLVENQKCNLQFLGYELEANRCFLYLQRELPLPPCLLRCNLLTQLFPDQKNLVTIIADKREFTYLLNRSKKDIMLNSQI